MAHIHENGSLCLTEEDTHLVMKKFGRRISETKIAVDWTDEVRQFIKDELIERDHGGLIPGDALTKEQADAHDR